MFCRYLLLSAFMYALSLASLNCDAQKNITDKTVVKESSAKENFLFNNDENLHIKIIGKLNALFNDRGDNPSYHPISIQYRDADSTLVSINLMAKIRGHFRRDIVNCKMPPILLDFSKTESIKHTVFEGQKKLKLIVPCQGEDYVIREWLVYKLYNLISDKSFKAKLVQVDFVDSLKQRRTETRYCILLEDEKKMAERNDEFVWKQKMLDMKSTYESEFKKMAVFQYMIGNTDWGIPYLQNIVLITKDSLMLPVAVPYDFDHAGIVGAPYAAPAPELKIASTRVRLYRGYCESDLTSFQPTFELFNRLKPEIYNLYTSCALLSPKYVKFVKRFLDDFYNTINNKRSIASEFGAPCRTNVRIEIKGLKK
ncbi:MAG: hypothetical protein ABIY62_00790 [Ginsengibacter sp.]